jgi:phosphate transport system permease protein
MGRPDPRSRFAARLRYLRGIGYAFFGSTAACALAVAVLFGLIAGFLAWQSWPSITRFGLGFLTGPTWNGVTNVYGAGPAVFGTVVTSLLALLIAVPVGLGVAIFLSEMAPPWLRRPLVYVVDLSAAVPSVVYGFWAFFVLVPLMRSTIEPGLASLTGGAYPFSSQSTGLDIFTATIVLAIMIIPTIAALSREALRAVPRINRESAWSLGATRWESTRMAVLGPARSGIVAGIILGLGRAIGETIAVTMVIGNIFLLPGTLFSPGVTLSTWIVNNFSEVGPGLEMQALLELALVLLAITVAVNVIARLLLWRIAERAQDGADGAPATGWLARLRRRAHRALPASPSGTQSASLAVDPPWRARLAASAPARVLRRRVVYAAMLGVTVLCVVLAVAPLASVILTAAENGGRAVVQPSFYTSLTPLGCNPRPGVTCSLGGIGPEIQGTLIMLGLGALIAVPFGLLAGIYLSEYGRGRVGRALSFFADVMTGIPTIIIGVFVFALVFYFDPYTALSAFSAGVALGVIMIPIITRATEEALRAVPSGVREAALALGFPRHRVTARVVLGTARGALVTGVLLAASRAAGDTAAIFLTAGGSSYWFAGLGTQTAAITPFIFENFGSPFANLREDAWGAALVLLAIMLAISLVSRILFRSASDAAEGI